MAGAAGHPPGAPEQLSAAPDANAPEDLGQLSGAPDAVAPEDPGQLSEAPDAVTLQAGATLQATVVTRHRDSDTVVAPLLG